MPHVFAHNWLQKLWSICLALTGHSVRGQKQVVRPSRRPKTDDEIMFEYTGLNELALEKLPFERAKGILSKILDDLAEKINEHAHLPPEKRPAEIQFMQCKFDERYTFFRYKGYITDPEEVFLKPWPDPYVDVT